MSRLGLDKRRGSGLAAALMLVLVGFGCGASNALAARATVTNPDDNYYVQMVDWHAAGNHMRLLFVTYPDAGQARARLKCNANYYVLDSGPGLASAQPQLLAENFCGHAQGRSGRLLANGDVLILLDDRVEVWRLGKGQVDAWSLSDVKSLVLDGRKVTGAHVGADPHGDIVASRALPYDSKASGGPSAVLAGLTVGGEQRWQANLAEPGVLLSPMDLWATGDGGALIHVTARARKRGTTIPGAAAPPGSIVMGQNRLYRVSAAGVLSAPIVIASMQMMDPSPPAALPDPTTDPAGYRAALQRQSTLTDMDAYTMDQLVAHPRDNGGMDVIMGRGTKRARLMRIGSSGEVLIDVTLDEIMKAEGLNAWQDAYVLPQEVLLFGGLSTQQGRLSQGYVSRISLADHSVVSRLVPLSELGLEEARGASDATVKFLEHNPAQQPQKLAWVGGNPLAISVVSVSKHQAFQLDEVTGQLAIYTEAREKRAAELARQQQRAQRQADREARNQVMVRGGDMNALLAAAMKQAELAQQQMQSGRTTGVNAEQMNAQIAQAVAQLQQVMGAQGNMAAGDSQPGSVAETSGPSAATPELQLDTSGRGVVAYAHPAGAPATLEILDTANGKLLLRKEYPGGTIHEFVDFTRFGIPLSRVKVVCRDVQRTLAIPKLVMSK